MCPARVLATSAGCCRVRHNLCANPMEKAKYKTKMLDCLHGLTMVYRALSAFTLVRVVEGAFELIRLDIQ